MLLDFYSISGLNVSFQKSEIFYSRVKPEDQTALTSLMGMKIGKLHVRYLGVPLISGKLKLFDCQPLIEKITARIKTWTTKFLSFTCRIQLIDSVLKSMVNFWMSVFMQPKRVIRAMESICCSYLWNAGLEHSHAAKVSWKQVCMPRTERGAEIERLEHLE